MKRKKFLTQTGMSLVQVMVASALTGVVSLGVMRITGNMNNITSGLETRSQELEMYQSIRQNLMDEASCTKTFLNKVPTANLTKIIRSNGTVLFDIHPTDAKAVVNFVRLKSAVLKNSQFGSCIDFPCTANVDLELEFVREKKNATISSRKTKKITITATIPNPGQPISKCFGDISSATANAKNESCAALGGVFNAAKNECNLIKFNPADLVSQSKAVSTDYLKDLNATLVPQFVKKAGDTMSGALQVNAKIESNNSICIKGNCRTTFTTQACPVGQVISENKVDGTITCSLISCPDTSTFFVGVGAGGLPICKAFPTKTCGVNFYVSKVNVDGSVVCSKLPPGTNKDCSPGLIQRIDPAGNHFCVADKNVYAKKCPPNQILNGFDNDGKPTCVADANVFGKLCAIGESLRGYDNTGKPVCSKPKAPEVREVNKFVVAFNGAPAKGEAKCNADEKLVGGGGFCVTSESDPTPILRSYSGANSWQMHCKANEPATYKFGAINVGAHTVAFCMKI